MIDLADLNSSVVDVSYIELATVPKCPEQLLLSVVLCEVVERQVKLL